MFPKIKDYCLVYNLRLRTLKHMLPKTSGMMPSPKLRQSEDICIHLLESEQPGLPCCRQAAGP